MRRKITMAVLIILTAFAQGILFEYFEIASIRPNLLLILTVSFGLMRSRMSGLLTGFFCGLALDVMFPGQLGFQALIYMWLGYGAGCCYRIFYDEDVKTPILLVAAADFLYGIYQYLFQFLIRGRINFPYYLRRIIIPEMLYTILFMFLFYRLLYHLNEKLNRTDKRSIDSLV